MSNQNYRLEEKNSKKSMSICSISQKQNMSRTGTALHIRIILPNCFYYPRNRKIYN